MDRGVVVIDDPVSSLDANSLFSAFGYMKERTEKASHLFVLTHNFSFFGQVKTWFARLPKSSGQVRFYLVESCEREGVRCGSLQPLDPLLRNYQSEYHFLFKKVYEEAHKTGVWSGLESCYEAPNLARRLLESFLSFRFPGDAGNVTKQIEHVSFSPARKARVLRLVHFGSHATHIAEPEHDLSILSETRQVLADLLDLMNAADPTHYAEMEKLVVAATPVPVGADSP
jgi:wobble nucleotide-excising tRNase